MDVLAACRHGPAPQHDLPRNRSKGVYQRNGLYGTSNGCRTFFCSGPASRVSSTPCPAGVTFTCTGQSELTLADLSFINPRHADTIAPHRTGRAGASNVKTECV